MPEVFPQSCLGSPRWKALIKRFLFTTQYWLFWRIHTLFSLLEKATVRHRQQASLVEVKLSIRNGTSELHHLTPLLCHLAAATKLKVRLPLTVTFITLQFETASSVFNSNCHVQNTKDLAGRIVELWFLSTRDYAKCFVATKPQNWPSVS